MAEPPAVTLRPFVREGRGVGESGSRYTSVLPLVGIWLLLAGVAAWLLW